MGDENNVLEYSKEDIQEIVLIHIRKTNLSKLQKRAIYEAIKADIKANKIPNSCYYIKSGKTTKDLHINLSCISLEVLFEILYISDYQLTKYMNK